ncbi:MAG: hypothetical protein RL030_1785 [Pseudomonadota bacterium]|jgi:hypothetical protein
MAVNIAGQTITGNTAPADSPRTKVGRVVFDATAIVATDWVVFQVGFTPKYVAWENLTDRIKNEWYEGMAADSAVNTVAAGTRTLSVTGTNGGITICDADGTPNVAGRSIRVLQNVALGAILASKTCAWMATA